jgi:putative transposase
MTAPKFKSRKNPVQSYTSQCNYPKKGKPTIEVDGNKIKLPKPGWVKFAKSREVEGRMLSVTVRRNPTGKYFISVLCEVEPKPFSKVNKNIGIDLGLKHFLVNPDGKKEEVPKVLQKI